MQDTDTVARTLVGIDDRKYRRHWEWLTGLRGSQMPNVELAQFGMHRPELVGGAPPEGMGEASCALSGGAP